MKLSNGQHHCTQEMCNSFNPSCSCIFLHFNISEMMTTSTFASGDQADPSGFIHVCLLFALCLLVIGLCLALMAAGWGCVPPVCLGDNDRRPEWPCLGRSSFSCLWERPLHQAPTRLWGLSASEDPVLHQRSGPAKQNQGSLGVQTGLGRLFPWSFTSFAYRKTLVKKKLSQEK